MPTTHFTRAIGAERTLLMLPLNVVMVGRVKGLLDFSKAASALEQLRSRHPLLAVRAQIHDDGTALYNTDGVPEFPVHVEPRRNRDQWIDRIKIELQTPFPIETGPLVRLAIVHSPDVSEIIICGHHAICDGMSMGYLLRDLLEQLADPERQLGNALIPPAIDLSTVPSPPSFNPIQRFVMRMINKKWSAKNLRFGESDMVQMHEEFWRKNSGLQVIAWNLNQEFTKALSDRCRTEKVTVNTALWTAFLAAQHDVQTDRLKYREHSALAVDTRDKLNTPVGEAFGFYASSLTVDLPYSPKKSFWNSAREMHSIINNELSRTNLFRMLISNMIDPTLIDSLYFNKYGLINESLSQKLLRKMGWHKITYGYALTNVGRFDIPTTYGPLQLETVYGPVVYSDVEEKVVGVITVGGILSCIMTCNEAVVGDCTRLKQTTMEYLKIAVGTKA